MGEVTSVYSMCGMCAVRCPIRVETQDGVVKWIEGNPHVPGIEGSLCAKGSAGLSFQYDTERPQHPMIRTGPRGSGQWRKATWDEALDFITGSLKKITEAYGSRAIALADRSGPFTDLTKSFLKALGSPNYFDHDDTCAKNVNLACQSVFGYGRGDISYDFTNTSNIVLYGRNVFESLQVKEVNNILDALDAGAKMTYIDIRATVTASKADKFLMIRPGTDYAFNLALIHVILKERLYDAGFVNKWVTGLPELEAFVAPYTPQWAEKETGIPAYEIARLAHDVSRDKPRVIFHGGWMLARYMDSFYVLCLFAGLRIAEERAIPGPGHPVCAARSLCVPDALQPGRLLDELEIGQPVIKDPRRVWRIFRPAIIICFAVRRRACGWISIFRNCSAWRSGFRTRQPTCISTSSPKS